MTLLGGRRILREHRDERPASADHDWKRLGLVAVKYMRRIPPVEFM